MTKLGAFMQTEFFYVFFFCIKSYIGTQGEVDWP